MNIALKNRIVTDLQQRLSHHLLDVLGDRIYNLAENLAGQYGQSYRKYHNWDHVYSLLCILPTDPVYQFAALFHDFYYDPIWSTFNISSLNEKASAKAFQKWIKTWYDQDYLADVLCDTFIDDVQNLIMATAKPYSYLDKNDYENKESVFVRADWTVLRGDIASLVEYENKIFAEYQWCDIKDYRIKRAQFLRRAATLPMFDDRKQILEELACYVETRKPRIGIFAGSFNPFHIGHLDILRQAEKQFDAVYLAVGCNPSKPDSVSSMKDRASALSEKLPYHQVCTFSGFMINLVKKLTAENMDVTIVRGLRTDTDFKKEEADLRASQDLMPELKVLYIVCNKNHEHVSSTVVKHMDGLEEGRGTSLYVPSKEAVYGGTFVELEKIR